MRILLVSNLYPPYILGGAEILAHDFASGLKARGHEVFVLTSSFGLPSPDKEEHIWRTLRYAPAAHFDSQRTPLTQLHLLVDYYRSFHQPRNASLLEQAISAIQPDMLYIWEITGLGVNTLLTALQKARLPIVYHLGSYWLQYLQSPKTAQTRLHLRRFKQALIGTVPELTYTSLIAVSQTVKNEYQQLGCDPERIEVIYNGIDSRFLTHPKTASLSSDSSTSTRLAFVGRLCQEKGALVLLQALDLLLHAQGRTGLSLDMYGDGDEGYLHELQHFIQEKHLENMVTFHGKVPQANLIEGYDRADIFLAPSLWKEPFGLVLAEAMARGLPVITSNLGGPAEIVTDEVDGLLVTPGDAPALAAAIARLVDHSDERARLAQNAVTTVQERFLSERNITRVEQHLLRALALHADTQPAPSLPGHR